MEKYTQFRDRGTGIAPFLSIPSEPAGIYLPVHVFLFLIRIPFLVSITLFHLVFLQWLSLPIITKGVLWALLGVQGTWWQDLQIDGVKRGSLAKNEDRLPQPGSIIASSFTSPLDCLYLAAIFDPVFTASYSRSRFVHRISLFQAMIRALSSPQSSPPPGVRLVDLNTILRENPDSCVVVFPECTTTNGRGILQLSPSLLTAPASSKIFPVNMRYTPGDITTPVPTSYSSFLWRACAKPAHCIRVRIAEYIYNTSAVSNESSVDGRSSENATDKVRPLSSDERMVLDKIGESLARLGRVKRLALGVEDKQEFVNLRKRK